MSFLSNLVRFHPSGKRFKLRRLTLRLETVLEQRYGLTAWELDALRYAMKPLRGPRDEITRRLIVVDPKVIGEPAPTSFDELATRATAVLFTGNIDSQDRVTLRATTVRKWRGPIRVE